MNIQLDQVSSIYFVGLGGIAMSATAAIAKKRGFSVSGSDAKELYSPSKEVLEEQGIQCFAGYREDQIKNSQADLYVVSAGEDASNPEIAWLIDNQKNYVSYAEFLYSLAEEKIRIVVTGTHGKSTTAGGLGFLLQHLDDSSFMTGAVLQKSTVNFHSGDGHYFVFEGDEYKATFEDPTPKFHLYKPDIVVLNNVEFDHPDIFHSLEEVKQEFAELLENLPDDGLVIYNADDVNASDVVYNQNHRAFGFSLENESEMKVDGWAQQGGSTRFRVVNKLDPENVRIEEYSTPLVGELNVRNALAMVTTLRALGFQPESIQHYLSGYFGVKRRFEIISETNGITIVDDFAHHPTAVRETLEAARLRFGEARIWTVFEPHTYSRTKATLPELSKSFGDANQVLLAPMYGAREHQDSVGIRDEEVLEAVRKNQPITRLVKDRAEALEILKAELKPGDVVIVMSAGTFNKLAYELAETQK